MRSVFMREEGIVGLADVNDAGAAAGLTARDRNYPGTLGTPIENRLAALSSGAEIQGGARTVGLSVVEAAAKVPAKRGRAK
jgi:hypothetical protein